MDKKWNFHVCGRIPICLFHTYIHFLFVKAEQWVTKKLKNLIWTCQITLIFNGMKMDNVFKSNILLLILDPKVRLWNKN